METKNVDAAVAQAEADIVAALAAGNAAEKSTATAAAAAETDDQRLERILTGIESVKKSVDTLSGRVTAIETGRTDEDDDEEDEDEDGIKAAKSTFLRRSLADIGANARGDQKQAAMDITTWLDGFSTVVKSIRLDHGKQLSALNAMVQEQGRQISLLLQLNAMQAKKGLAAVAATAAESAGRASQLTVIGSAAAGAEPELDLSKVPAPAEMKRLALKALSAGKISPQQVALIETYMNGTGPVELGGAPPMLPPKHLLDICLDMRSAA